MLYCRIQTYFKTKDLTMAVGNFLALLDDISAVLDDVALMTKVAAQKTAGVVVDDLAVSPEQVAGMQAQRELPVVYAVAKGSAINKAIIIPVALLLSAFAPSAIIYLLMVGGIYLCFEGFEKVIDVYHKKMHPKVDTHPEVAFEDIPKKADGSPDIEKWEKSKIKGAIRTDFVLSTEIMVIALGTMTAAGNVPLLNQLLVLTLVAVAMTVGVYGIVAGIVKLDDVGFWLMKKTNAFAKKLGYVLVNAAPSMMKFLAVAGTVAMFSVGGGIMGHGLHELHTPLVGHAVHSFVAGSEHTLGLLGEILANIVVGVVAGVIAVGLYDLWKHAHKKFKKSRTA